MGTLDIERLAVAAECELFRAGCGIDSGEQFRGMHVNQTLTGIAIGSTRNSETDA